MIESIKSRYEEDIRVKQKAIEELTWRNDELKNRLDSNKDESLIELDRQYQSLTEQLNELKVVLKI